MLRQTFFGFTFFVFRSSCVLDRIRRRSMLLAQHRQRNDVKRSTEMNDKVLGLARTGRSTTATYCFLAYVEPASNERFRLQKGVHRASIIKHPTAFIHYDTIRSSCGPKDYSYTKRGASGSCCRCDAAVSKAGSARSPFHIFCLRWVLALTRKESDDREKTSI